MPSLAAATNTLAAPSPRHSGSSAHTGLGCAVGDGDEGGVEAGAKVG